MITKQALLVLTFDATMRSLEVVADCQGLSVSYMKNSRSWRCHSGYHRLDQTIRVGMMILVKTKSV